MLPERRRWMEEVIALKVPRNEEEAKEDRAGGEFWEGVESVDSRRAIPFDINGNVGSKRWRGNGIEFNVRSVNN